MAVTPDKRKMTIATTLTPPLKREFHYQDIIDVGEQKLLRSYSCGQIFGINSTGKPFAASSYVVFATPIREKGRKRKIQFDTKENIPKKKVEKNRYKFLSLPCFIRFASPTLSVLICIYVLYSFSFSFTNGSCNFNWNTTPLMEELSVSLFGQETVIQQLPMILKDSTKERPIVVFTGPVGVGKSFAMNSIRRHFPLQDKTKIIHVSKNLAINVKDFSLCGNLVIFEDCNLSNIDSVIDFVQNLVLTKVPRKNLFLFLLYTSTESNFPYSGENFSLVPFNQLSRESVLQCILKEALRLGINLNYVDLEKIISYQMLTATSDIGCSPGCKNIDSLLSKYIV